MWESILLACAAAAAVSIAVNFVWSWGMRVRIRRLELDMEEAQERLLKYAKKRANDASQASQGALRSAHGGIDPKDVALLAQGGADTSWFESFLPGRPEPKQ